jgi:hypothetical protein
MSDEKIGTDNNEFVNEGGEESFDSFDDLGDDTFDGGDGDGFDDLDEDTPAPVKKGKSEKEQKKEADKKAKGQKGDDMEALDQVEDEQEEESEEEESDDESEEESDEESKDAKEKPEDKEAKDKESKEQSKKGKPSYVEVDGETFALDSNAIIHTKVDGKTEKVTLQELKNNYAGKVAYDKKMNEVNLKESQFRKEQESFKQQVSTFTGLKSQIEKIVGDVNENPKKAFKIVVDALGFDSYDLEERMFKADLQELAEVLAMEPAERKAYLLEKKTSHLLERDKKREEARQAQEKRNSYQAKADQLRKSFNVSEAQYVDAYEELLSYGHEGKDLSEQEIVEWAATKPHRETVKGLLAPYADQFNDEVYGELSWRLAKILLAGQDTPENITLALKEAYGEPTEVKELSKKLKPLGRKPASKTKQTHTVSKSKAAYESFDDIEDDD